MFNLTYVYTYIYCHFEASQLQSTIHFHDGNRLPGLFFRKSNFLFHRRSKPCIFGETLHIRNINIAFFLKEKYSFIHHMSFNLNKHSRNALAVFIVHEKKLQDQTHQTLQAHKTSILLFKRNVIMWKDPLIICFWIQWMSRSTCHADLANKKLNNSPLELIY